MTKQKILLLIPLAIIAGYLIYTWSIILTTNNLAVWQHYAALVLFIPLLYLYFKRFYRAVAAVGIYFLLGTATVLAITPDIQSSWLRIGPITTPEFQPLFLGLLTLFIALNFDTLAYMYSMYKEKKAKQRKEISIRRSTRCQHTTHRLNLAPVYLLLRLCILK